MKIGAVPTFAPDNSNDDGQGSLSSNLFAPDGEPWCAFRQGSLYCVNEWCLNPNHRPPPDERDDDQDEG